jgi:PAS domain-containing protein
MRKDSILTRRLRNRSSPASPGGSNALETTILVMPLPEEHGSSWEATRPGPVVTGLSDVEHRLAARLNRTEQLGNLGWGHWNLITGEIVWSPQLYVIHGCDPADGPLTMEEYSSRAHPEDLPVIERAMTALAESGESHEFEVRFRIGDDTRHIRISAEAVRDVTGEPLEIRGVMQDITAWRQATDELASANRRLAEENQLSIHLQTADRLPVVMDALVPSSVTDDTCILAIQVASPTREGG